MTIGEDWNKDQFENW